jgi:hypothetical protein
LQRQLELLLAGGSSGGCGGGGVASGVWSINVRGGLGTSEVELEGRQDKSKRSNPPRVSRTNLH